MIGLLLLLFLWCIFSIFLRDFLFPLLGELLAWGIQSLVDAISTALLALLLLLAKGVHKALGFSLRAARAAALFLHFWIAEMRSGPEPESEEDDFAEEFSEEQEFFDEPEPAIDPYEEALAVLGLARGFTRQALNRTYKQLMRKVHPDAPGGSTAAAQAVNAARDFLLNAHGWA